MQPSLPNPAEGTINVARFLPRAAKANPTGLALRIPKGRLPSGEIRYLDLTFAELNAEADGWARRLAAAGVTRGMRVLLMARPGLPLIALCFALFKLGAPPVVIDPGMGLKGFLACVRRSRPEALAGIPLAMALSRVFRGAFASVRIRVKVGADERLGGTGASPVETAGTASGDLAAILFTSGSTGAAKGVCYEHGMFEAQVEAIRAAYAIEPGEVDLPMLPIFALFNPALGMTTVVPEINPSRPGTVDPAKIVQAIQQCGVTNSFGSPTLWRKISKHCLERGIALPTLKRVLMAGAPVPPGLMGAMRQILTQGLPHSPYGATEALPVSSISAAEVLDEGLAEAASRGAGTCVGRPLPGVRVRVVRRSSEAIRSIEEAEEVAAGEIGEIIVSGPSVTKRYDQLPEATERAKIADGAGHWHRMGDLGYFDAAGRLWFCGRYAEQVSTAAGPIPTELCEGVFINHPAVARVALIGWADSHGNIHPALAVEPELGRWPRGRRAREALAVELRQLGRELDPARRVQRFFFVRRFPVDVRHNAKIHRLTLARRLASSQPVTVA
jgi:olefin beta-lactone synthetase